MVDQVMLRHSLLSDMYRNVPITSPVIVTLASVCMRARPKSVMYSLASPSSMRLAGLMSR